MKKIFEKWWDNDTKYCSIINYKLAWKAVGNKPRLHIHHNGGKRKNGDKCFDVSLIVGYVIFNYTNFDLQKEGEQK